VRHGKSRYPWLRIIMALLEVKNISKRFGGLQAVKDVSFSVEQGMIKAVIGPNGAGKTTLFNLISGFLPPDSGSVLYRDRQIQAKNPYQIADWGISRTFQHIRLFHGMTVLENIMVGRHTRSRAGFIAGMLNLPWTWQEEHAIREHSLEIMEFLGIRHLADTDASSLSYGQQRVVELARALAGEPDMLLLDEPAAGLNMRETADMASLISKIRKRGVTVLIVEHDMQLVMNISDEIVVLSYGEKIADDAPRSVQRDPEVVRVYLGEEDA
jgi:branched-chain amino acid transport system ATP-binding protein